MQKRREKENMRRNTWAEHHVPSRVLTGFEEGKADQRRPEEEHQTQKTQKAGKVVSIALSYGEQGQEVAGKRSGQWRPRPHPLTLEVIQITWALLCCKTTAEAGGVFVCLGR